MKKSITGTLADWWEKLEVYRSQCEYTETLNANMSQKKYFYDSLFDPPR